MIARTFVLLALLVGLAAAVSVDIKIPTVDVVTKVSTNEAGQKAQDSGPDSWQFWGPNRQLLNTPEQDKKGKYVNEEGFWGGSGPDSWQAYTTNIERIMMEKVDDKAAEPVNERGGRGGGGGGDRGPDSWQFWQPARQLRSAGTLYRPVTKNQVNEAGQKAQEAGPDSWQFWTPNRQLKQIEEEGDEIASANVNEAGQKAQEAGPDSWQFWGPNRQLLNQPAPAKPAAPQQAAKKPEAAPKPAAPKPAQAAAKPEAAPKPAAPKPAAPKQAAVKPEAAQKQAAPQPTQQTQQAPNVQPERGFRGWGWGANADLAGMPGGGQAYPLQNGRNIYSAAGWGGAPVTCAQGQLAHSCATHRKMLH